VPLKAILFRKAKIWGCAGADAIKKFTLSLGIPYLGAPKIGVSNKILEPIVTPKSELLTF